MIGVTCAAGAVFVIGGIIMWCRRGSKGDRAAVSPTTFVNEPAQELRHAVHEDLDLGPSESYTEGDPISELYETSFSRRPE